MNLSKLFLSLLAAGCLLQASMTSAQDSAKPSEPMQAVWQPRELNFHFMGFKTYYSCSSIEDRLEQVLRELGAKSDVRVVATGCVPAEVSKTITARIQVSMPVDAGNAATPSEATFPAQRKTVTLTTNADHQRSSGDCELMEQVRDQLLTALQLKIVKDDVRCFPGQSMIGSRTLQVMALVPVVQAEKK